MNWNILIFYSELVSVLVFKENPQVLIKHIFNPGQSFYSKVFGRIPFAVIYIKTRTNANIRL